MSISAGGKKINFKNKLIYLILAFFLVPSAVFAANSFSLSPTSQTVNPNQSFSVQLLVDSTTNLFGVGFDLLFDPGLIQFISAESTGSLLTVGATSQPSLLTGVNPAGDLVFSLSRFNPDIGVSTTSTSTIAVLNFQALALTGTTSSTTVLTFPSGFTSLCIIANSGDACAYQNGTWINGTVTIRDITAPTTPGSFTASTVSAAAINLSWASSTDASGISKYYIYRTSTTTPIASTTGLTYGDSGLSAGTAYNYFIRSMDLAGNYSAYATSSATTLGDLTLPNISILTPTADPTYNASTSLIALTGTSTDNIGVSSVTWSNSRGGSGTAVGTSSWTIGSTTLQTGSNVISVVAHDGSGNTASDTISINLDTSKPTIPTSTPASATAASASQVNISWPAGADTGNSGLAGYQIYRDSTTSAPIASVASTTLSFSDTGRSASTLYTYYIFAVDSAGNISTGFATASATTPAAPVTGGGGGGGGGGGNPSIPPVNISPSASSTGQTNVVSTTTSQSSGSVAGEAIINLGSLANATGAEVDAVSLNEAQMIFGNNQFVDLTATNKKIYEKIMAQAIGLYDPQAKRALAYFIQLGSPTTLVLGAGERGGSVGSYLSAFKRLPKTVSDWQDAVKIANGRWPKERNANAELAAEKEFKKIYLRAPKRTLNKYDDNAVIVIAYGLRPAKRNLASEVAAIKSFKYIYKRVPAKSNEWDIVRAIAYSGAKR